jgi:hypothetical protein
MGFSRRPIALKRAGLVMAFAIVSFLATSCGGVSTSAESTPARPAKPQPHDVTDVDGFTCKSNWTRYGLCPANPFFGKNVIEARVARVAREKAKARAEAKRRAAEARRQAARTAAHEAYVQSQNAWHQGYYAMPVDTYGESDPGGYAKFVEGIPCEEYAGEYGCWHVEVIVRDGCQSYVGVQANEYLGGAVVNDLLANNGTGIPPKTPVRFELDASQPDVTLNDLKVQCN